MLTDLSLAFRQLRKNPLVSLAAVVSLALALGANTTLFSVFERLVLRPHTFREPGTLVRVWINNPARNLVAPAVSRARYEQLREHSTVFACLGASVSGSFAFAPAHGEPEQVPALQLSREFFPALGVEMARGRNFLPEEDVPGAAPVAVVSHEFWQTRLGGRETVLGESVSLNGVPHTVIGVLPPRLSLPFSQFSVFTSRWWEPNYLTAAQVQVGATYLQVTARLKPGVALERANEELAALSRRYKVDFATRLDADSLIDVRTLTEELSGNVRPTVHMLLAAVAAVLLIAIANVSNLFLARLSTRQKEIAVRLALGARPGDLVRQFLVEGGLFAALATGGGVLLGHVGLRLIEQFAANQLLPNTHFTIGGPVLLFSACIGALTAVGVAAAPAWQATRIGVAEVLKDTARGQPGGTRGGRFRAALIVAEVALSVVLLVGSGLLLVSFFRLQQAPAGLDPIGVGYAQIGIPIERYRTVAQQGEFYERVVERLKAVPQVRFAAAGVGLPLGGIPLAPYTVDGEPIKPLSERSLVGLQLVMPEFFQVLGIPLREGRFFTARDREGAPGVCIINESLARRLFPHGSALGRHLRRGRDAEIVNEIVGVVGDVSSNGLGVPAPDVIYYSFFQLSRASALLFVRVDGEPESAQALIRTAVREVDRAQPVASFSTMPNLVAANTGFQRLVAGLTGFFAGVALLLTAVGLYSVLAYSVGQRTGEIGIRMALGAERGDIVRLVLRQGLRLVGAGLVLGIAAAAGSAWLIRALLFGVEPFNPLVFVVVAVLFLGIALLACLLPARRAARVDPLVALRTE